ncbi:MAG: ArsR family transcriptional regulator [Thermoplasmatales archaeon]
MNEEEVRVIGEILRNDKRTYILKQLAQDRELTWTEITRRIEDEFKIKVNPNTVSFHLSFLIKRNFVKKVGDHYVFNENSRAIMRGLMK